MFGKYLRQPAVLLLLILAYFVIVTPAQRFGNSTPRKFDEYVLEGELRWLRLDRFVAQLKREPKKRAYVIVYAARKISGPGVYYDGEAWTRWVGHNMKARGLREDQFMSVYGGLR